MFNILYELPIALVMIFSFALFVEDLSDISKAAASCYVICGAGLGFVQYLALVAQKTGLRNSFAELEELVAQS